MKLIVGLGNPGKEYSNTRHNVGFYLLDSLADTFNVSFDKTKFSGEYTDFIYNNEKVILLKPSKYMNLSGEVVKDFVSFFKIDINDILIVCDDLDTPVGTFRFKNKGSSGGHNGLKNIELHLSTQNFKRFKVGISNNKSIDTKSYVLGKFSREEKDKLETISNIFPNIIKDYLTLSFEQVISKYNGIGKHNG